MLRITTGSVKETEDIGEQLGKIAFPGMVILLTGDLGAGKTTFARGIARGLNVTSPVTSPTFTLIEEHYGRLPLYHMDVYRLNTPEELEDIGYEEYVGGDGLCLIEWGDQVREWLPAQHLEIRLEGVGEKRTLTLIPSGNKYEQLVKELRQLVVGSHRDGNTDA